MLNARALRFPSWLVVVALLLCGSGLAQATTAATPGQAGVTLPGQSATLLPTGQWLLLGGQVADVPTISARTFDPLTQRVTDLPTRLPQPRSGHSATVLPDGRVMILGGTGPGDVVIETALAYDPLTGVFAPLPISGLTARSEHTATVLTDGRVLIAGGITPSGALQRTVELIDTVSWTAETLDAELDAPRFGHLANLMPASTVLLWGGYGAANEPLSSASLFAPTSEDILSVPSADVPTVKSLLVTPGIPAITGSIPTGGATGVPIDARLSLRFSAPLQPASFTTESVVLYGPLGVVVAKVVPTEGGLLLFVTPAQQLLPDSQYTLFLSGPQDATGRRLPFSSIAFHTAALDPNTAASPAAGSGRSNAGIATKPAAQVLRSTTKQADSEDDSDEEWIPGPAALRGDWRARRAAPKLAKASVPQAPEGVTALAGLVLRLNGKPLVHATLSVANRTTTTDADGYFLLSDIPAGKNTLVIDGASANRPGATYGYFESVIEINAGRTNVLPYTIWLPLLDTQHTIKLPSPTTAEVVVTTPRIPGFELRIPKGVVIRDRSGRALTEIGITAVPIDRTPFPQAPMEFPVYYTVQPGGASLQGLDGGKVASAKVVYPNYVHAPPGQAASFWLYDPVDKGWYIYGQGAVSADGTSVVPAGDAGLYEFTGGGYSPGNPPWLAPPPCAKGTCCGPSPLPGPLPTGGGGSDSWQSNNGPGNPNCPGAGDPVDLGTGTFSQTERDLAVNDVVPLSVVRTYTHTNPNLGPFGIGTSSTYDLYLYTADAINYPSVTLVLPNGSQVVYARTSGGTGIVVGTSFKHTSSGSEFYNSTITVLLQAGSSHPDFVLQLIDGRSYTFYHHLGKLMSFSDRNGNATTINRVIVGDDPGAITSIVGPTGRRLIFASNSDGTISQIKDDLGRTFGYSYIGQYLRTVTDPEMGTRVYTYDANNRMRTVKDPNGNTRVTIDYDGNGRVMTETYADLSTMHFAYTLLGTTVSMADVTDQRGQVRHVEFDTQGYLNKSIYPVGQPESQTITFVHDFVGFLQTSTDARGRTTRYTYDTNNGNVQTITRLYLTADAVTTTYTYEPTFQQVNSVTDPLGHSWTATYDAQGNQVTATDPLGHTTILGYNGRGQLISATDPLGHTTTAAYDGADLVSVTDPLSRTAKVDYDSAGRPIRQTSPMGHTTQTVYDKLNRVTQMTDSLAGAVNFTYWPNGDIKTSQDQMGHITSYAYNSLGKLASHTDALLHSDATLYDVAGQFAQFTDRKGQISTAAYDNMGRRNFMGFGAVGTAPYSSYQSFITFSYDNASRVHVVADSTMTGSTTRNYDELDRMTQEINPQGTVNYTYYNSGMRRTMTVSGQPIVTYLYYDDNRLQQIQSGLSGSGLGTVSFTYDDAGRRQTSTLANGVVATYGYDNADQLTSITYANGMTTVGNLTYTYDADGRQITKGGSMSSTGLPAAVASTTYNANNQLTLWGAQTFAYDLNGNLIGDGAKIYGWDSRDQLASLTGAVTATFAYDAFGRRIGKTINSTNTGYVYDVANFTQELNGSTPKANLLTGLGVDEVFLRNQSGTSTNFLADALGSTVALTDGSGAVATSYTYEPYGATTQAGAANDNNQQFTGRENDGTGLTYYRARYYIANCGRFISEDPIGIAGGINLYGYAGASPTNFADPLGLAPWYNDGYHWVLRHNPWSAGCRAALEYQKLEKRAEEELRERDRNRQEDVLAGEIEAVRAEYFRRIMALIGEPTMHLAVAAGIYFGGGRGPGAAVTATVWTGAFALGVMYGFEHGSCPE